MSGIKDVTVIGSSSALAKALINTLAISYTVTVLHRSSTTPDASLPSSIKFVSVADYEDVPALATALTGADAVVSTVGFTGLALQIKFIDAAIAAGVKRFLPSEFGSSLTSEETRALPMMAAKLAVREYLAKVAAEKGFQYDLIVNGIFLEMGLQAGFIGFSLPTLTAELVDGGNTPYAISSYPYIARAVSAVLSRPATNGQVEIYEIRKTSREFLSVVQSFTSTDGWTVTEPNSGEWLQEGLKLLGQGDIMGGITIQVKVATQGMGYGADYEGVNEQLGLTPLGEDEVREVIRKAVVAAGKTQ